MKKTLITALAVVVLVLTRITHLSAQETGDLEFHINTGISLPTGPAEAVDHWRIALAVGAGVGYTIHKNVVIAGHFDSNHFLVDNTRRGVGEVSIFLFSLRLRTALAAATKNKRPYLFAGTGLLHLASEEVEADPSFPAPAQAEDASETVGCILLGAGLEFTAAQNTALYIEGGWVLGFTEGDSKGILPLRLGLRFH